MVTVICKEQPPPPGCALSVTWQRFAERRWPADFWVFAALVLCSGCASFSKGTLSPIGAWPLQASTLKKSISVTVSVRLVAALSGVPMASEPEQSQQEEWRDRTFVAYRDSGLFSDVHNWSDGSALRADVEIEDRESGSIASAVLLGLTLGLVPVKVSDDTIVMRTTFRDENGYAMATVEKSEAVSTWWGLPVLFVMPFSSLGAASPPSFVPSALIENLSRATLAEAHGRTVF